MEIDLKKFQEEQIEQAKKVLVKDSFKKLNLFGGCSQANLGKRIISAVVVCDESMQPVEQKDAVVETEMPYIPDFLFFREGKAVMEAFRKLDKKPDVLMVNANGILHPLRIGMASHVGVLLDVPTIGIAKSAQIVEKEDGRLIMGNEIRGYEFHTRKFSKPVYISPGHRISLDTSIEIVKKCIMPPHKLPEPLHLAHKLANSLRKSMVKS